MNYVGVINNDRKIRDLIKDKQIDINNHKSSYMLIERFVRGNLEGIKLKEGEIMDCPICGCEHQKSEKE